MGTSISTYFTDGTQTIIITVADFLKIIMVCNLCHLLPVKTTKAAIIQVLPVYVEPRAENASLLVEKLIY